MASEGGQQAQDVGCRGRDTADTLSPLTKRGHTGHTVLGHCLLPTSSWDPDRMVMRHLVAVMRSRQTHCALGQLQKPHCVI